MSTNRVEIVQLFSKATEQDKKRLDELLELAETKNFPYIKKKLERSDEALISELLSLRKEALKTDRILADFLKETLKNLAPPFTSKFETSELAKRVESLISDNAPLQKKLEHERRMYMLKEFFAEVWNRFSSLFSLFGKKGSGSPKVIMDQIAIRSPKLKSAEDSVKTIARGLAGKGASNMLTASIKSRSVDNAPLSSTPVLNGAVAPAPAPTTQSVSAPKLSCSPR